MFKGKRTYGAIGAIVALAVVNVLEGGAIILSPEITAGLITVLGGLAAYFRRAA